MANFQTHLSGGALVASVAAFACHGQGLTDTEQTQLLFTIGVAASLLPDIDADDSRPARTLFLVLGAALGFVVALPLADRLAPVDLMLVWAGVGFAVRYPLRWLFARHTVHRGIWHTQLMAVVLALLAAVIADNLFGATADFAWLVGGFTLLGYVTHLVLDEWASVDLLGRRVKRSFGTALKPLSLRAWPASLMLTGLLVVLIGISPDPTPLFDLAGRLGLPPATLAAHWPRW